MPSVGHFLQLLEAISRRDWEGVSNTVHEVAERERELKHCKAAHQLLEAAEVATADSGYDRVGTLALSSSHAVSAPPDLVERVESKFHHSLVLPTKLRASLRDLIQEWQFEKELLAKGLAPRRTLLLHGQPGCGKTHIAHHLAESLNLPLFLVRFDALVSSFLGETASNLHRVFEFFSNNRVVLFLDEIDAIAKLRDDKNELGELKRVVISLLQNIDHSTPGSMLVAATNHPHLLDPALWRRFESVWEIPLPTEGERLKILEAGLGDTGASSDVVALLADKSDGYSGADLVRIGESARRRSVLDPSQSGDDALLLAFIQDAGERFSRAEGDDSAASEIALALRRICGNRRYSFKALEQLTGIPSSTLHHRSQAQT